MADLIDRQAAIDALWGALREYEDKTEKQFQESEDLDVGDWIEHRVFVQNMNDIDRQTILNLPTAQPEMKRGRWFPIFIGEHGYSAGDFRCSVCGAPNKCYCLTKYCANCGAQMGERSDDERFN